MSKIIEVDTDNVLANMDGSYGPYIRSIVPDFTEEKYVCGWNLPYLNRSYPEAGEKIRQLYNDPTYIKNLSRFDKVETAMNILTSIPDCYTVVYTHVFNEEVADARREWLEELMIDSDSNFDINIRVGGEKTPLPDSFVTIEDSIENLNASNATIKILVKGYQNRDCTVEDIKGGEQRYVVNSFFDAVMLLDTILDK